MAKLPMTADVPIIMALAQVRSVEHARRLAAIPGVVIPQRLVARLEGARDEADASERFWSYLDAELTWLGSSVPIRGYHLMPIGNSRRSIGGRSSFAHLYECASHALGGHPGSVTKSRDDLASIRSWTQHVVASALGRAPGPQSAVHA